MAEHLASIFGTEKDRVNCPFYFKIGACRHGDRCSRLHTKPSISPTLLLSNMYQRPDMITPGVDPQGQALDPRKIQDHFEDFYEDLFEELSKYGEIESLNICDNLADHMVGNVYVQFREEEHAANALRNLNGRFYAGRPIIVDFSPVTDFREATCRQYEENVCNRGGYCNFMHLKKISRSVLYIRIQLIWSSGGDYLGEIGEGTAAVGAEVVVHKSTVVMRSVHMVVVVVEEEMMTEISATMKEAGGREAEALDVRGDEVEARREGGIEAQLEKVVLRGGLGLSNGTGKRSKQKLVVRLTIAMMIGITMAMRRMEINTLIPSRSKQWFRFFLLPQDRASIFIAAYHDICIQVAVVVCRAGLQDCNVRLLKHEEAGGLACKKITIKESARIISFRFTY
ncbi:hypothetical protein JRO89_XS12G0010800 [Xanthoceras sorbifolium]|uniref:Splicing factor U2af small subunit B n=1 Tax=Xanthoceras sorbifolium TaxID=99658 RepID=A0ABQ8HAA4_9ROSI|nr:hypothetical protein JRO89_XS12G0010800 [Xanthoceras sorbifolium]